jgi:phage host-nuclease inhibitor protein Gam
MAAKHPVTSLYVRYVQAQMLKHNHKSYEAPVKYSEHGKELDEKYEKHLQSIIDAEITRLLEESDDKVLDISKYSEDPQKLKDHIQLLVDGVQYRAQEKGDDAHKAIESE